MQFSAMTMNMFFPSNDELTDFMTQTLAGIPGILTAETNIILKPVRSLFPGAPVQVATRHTPHVTAMNKTSA
jgi:hypothetical protein